jgi:kumamolisin
MSQVSSSNMVELKNSIHQIPAGSKGLRPTNGQRWLELTLGLHRKKALPALSALDKERPAHRNYLTREQLADEFGPDPKSLEEIEAFAKAHHPIVTRDERASARVGIAGTVADLSAAFA